MQQEKEADRERRADLRGQAKAAAERAAALDKTRKEQDHYRNLLAKLDPSTDPEAHAGAQADGAAIGRCKRQASSASCARPTSSRPP